MVPKLVDFGCEGDSKQVANRAYSFVNGYATVGIDEHKFGPALLAILPKTEEPLVFDPPPMVA